MNANAIRGRISGLIAATRIATLNVTTSTGTKTLMSWMNQGVIVAPFVSWIYHEASDG